MSSGKQNNIVGDWHLNGTLITVTASVLNNLSGTNTGDNTVATAWATGSAVVPSARAYDSGGTTLAANGFTKINLATESFDVGGMFSGSKYTPTKAGIYRVSGIIYITNGALLTQYAAAVYLNGSIYTQGSIETNTVANNMSFGVNALVNMNGTTDYLELYGSNGHATNTAATSTNSWATYLEINYVGPAT